LSVILDNARASSNAEILILISRAIVAISLGRRQGRQDKRARYQEGDREKPVSHESIHYAAAPAGAAACLDLPEFGDMPIKIAPGSLSSPVKTSCVTSLTPILTGVPQVSHDLRMPSFVFGLLTLAV